MSDPRATTRLDAIVRQFRPGDPLLDAKQVLRALERSDPLFAAQGRAHRRRLKAWQRERDQLADEIGHLQIPFVVAVLNQSEPVADAACVVVRVCDYLFDNDAPASLMRDLLRVTERLLS